MIAQIDFGQPRSGCLSTENVRGVRDDIISCATLLLRGTTVTMICRNSPLDNPYMKSVGMLATRSQVASDGTRKTSVLGYVCRKENKVCVLKHIQNIVCS